MHNLLGRTHNCVDTRGGEAVGRAIEAAGSTPSEIISNRVCGMCLGIGEGANLIISK